MGETARPLRESAAPSRLRPVRGVYPSTRPARGTVALLVATVLLFVGLLPVLHHHEPADVVCELGDLPSSAHLEGLDLEHQHPCSLCGKTLPSAGLERVATSSADETVVAGAAAAGVIPPPGPPARHGASRAPPRA